MPMSCEKRPKNAESGFRGNGVSLPSGGRAV
jgi:hypothetical protein